MNKQELIGKLKSKKFTEIIGGMKLSHNCALEQAIELAEQLEEPKECKIIYNGTDDKMFSLTCSICGNEENYFKSIENANRLKKGFSNFCSNCGAKIIANIPQTIEEKRGEIE